VKITGNQPTTYTRDAHGENVRGKMDENSAGKNNEGKHY
jgi:hypothetical protein